MGGTTTGISAHDRSATVRALVDPNTRAQDFMRPGHVFPLVAKAGGVLRRAGHTEATVDLARLAGLAPAGVLCEVLDEDGSMARLPRLLEIAAQFNLKIVTIADLIAYRRRSEKLVEKVREIRFPSEFGDFTLHLYRSLASGHNHIALTRGEIEREEPVLVRVHSQCFTGDVLGSLRCDCKTQLDMALAHIAEHGIGMVIYLRQEGRGTGLVSKIDSYALQDTGLDTVEASGALGVPVDARTYELAGEVIRLFDIASISLLTNNPAKIDSLRMQGIAVARRIPMLSEPNQFNDAYLRAKTSKMSHLS